MLDGDGQQCIATVLKTISGHAYVEWVDHGTIEELTHHVTEMQLYSLIELMKKCQCD